MRYDSQGLSRVARTLLEICTVGILAVPTVEVSLLCLLFNVAVCGVTADLLAESEGGAQTRRFVGGTSQIPLRLAAALGDRVVLDSPVLTIDYTAGRVTVTCRGGLVAAGRQVIVALSPALAGRIMYDPPLPGVRDQLTQRMPHASAHKMFAIYDEPFWRADGLNAQLISEVGPARMSNDSCLPDEAGGPGIILAFLEGESARVAGRWPAGQRHSALRAELGRHFGRRAAEPQRIVERGWADREWIRGCYNSNMGPCGLLHFGAALSEPIGPVKWAATETAHAWSGYMEGAVEASHTNRAAFRRGTRGHLKDQRRARAGDVTGPDPLLGNPSSWRQSSTVFAVATARSPSHTRRSTTWLPRWLPRREPRNRTEPLTCKNSVWS